MTGIPTSLSISKQAADAYEEHLNTLISTVDKRMTIRLKDTDLIGSNPLSVMYDNHENHGRLLSNVLKFNDLVMLSRILPWVVKNYSTKGFSLDYFLEVLDQWQDAVTRHLSAQAAAEILPVYQWMKETVPGLYEQYAAGTLVVTDIQEVMKDSKSGEIRDFTELLVNGKHREAHIFIADRVQDKQSLIDIYTNLLRPSMYEVGRLWEADKITVAHEHLATSIVLRIITFFYGDLVYTEQTKGRAVVTASANEYHEIGARMEADLLEMDGWDVSYLGANTPIDDLIGMLDSVRPDILCISVTMAFNLSRVKDLIASIRKQPRFDTMKIMVGGHAIAYSGTAVEALGADAVETSAAGSILTAERWWKEIAHA